MLNVSLLEKLKLFIEIIRSNDVALYIIPFLLVIVLLIIRVCKINSVSSKILYLSIYVGILGVLVYNYHTQLLSLIDYMIENIVANILFPNLAIYIGVLLVINVIVIFTIFSKKVKPYIRNINIVSFAIMQLFLYLIVDNIITNNVNVYEKLSIYTNNNLLVLVELSMQLFVVWIGVLLITRFIEYLINKSYKEVSIKKDLSLDEVLELKEEDRSLEIYEKEFNKLVLEEEKEINYYADYIDDEAIIEYVPIKKKA